MCGIVGLVTQASNGFTNAELDSLEQMLVVNSLRGADSTGLFGVNTKGETSWIKVVGDPYELFPTNMYTKFRSKAFSEMNMLVGHGRKATKGAITTKNAHPFCEDQIILVHNGSLSGINGFNRYHSFDVDSRAIAAAFAENNEEEVIPNIKGAFALVWYNAKDEKLKFVRNKERPLAIAETQTGLYFMSDIDMLEFVTKKSMDIVKKMWEVPEGILFEYDPKEHDLKEKQVKLHSFVSYPPCPAHPMSNGYLPEYEDDDYTVGLPPYDKNKYPKAEAKATNDDNAGNKVANFLPKRPRNFTTLDIFEKKDIIIVNDDVVEFKIKELTRINQVKDQYQVFGELVLDPSVEIVSYYHGPLEDLNKNKIYCAVVKSMLEKVNKEDGIAYRFWCNDLKESPQVESLQREQFSVSSFILRTACGCDVCKDIILVEDAGETYISPTMVMCKKCVLDTNEALRKNAI